jgi:hypothetical protein
MIISMLLYVGVSYGVVFNTSGMQTNYLARSGGYESPGLLSITLKFQTCEEVIFLSEYRQEETGLNAGRTL